MDGYDKHYSDESFWEKLKRHAMIIGRETVQKAAVLYFCMKDPDTPAQAKLVIVGALGYLIFPADAIPDMIVPVGYSDDIGALALAATIVAIHIKDSHVTEAKALTRRFFGGDEPDANAAT
jgi:uncharacterized membrane protein YkvA (DUF1232 family)